MLPLYQALGEEGFFLAREISNGWLWFGAALRRSGVDRRLAVLPGVHRDREHAIRRARDAPSEELVVRPRKVEKRW